MLRLVIFGLIIGLFFACKKTEEFPVVPEIELKDFKKMDSVVDGLNKSFIKFTIGFKDGDGDIGLKKEETSAPYDVNLIFKEYIRTMGVFLISPRDSGDDYRVPYLTPAGSNKNISGEVSVDYALIPGLLDTAYFEIFILDRALHKSNVVRTPEIIIDTR